MPVKESVRELHRVLPDVDASTVALLLSNRVLLLT